MSRHEGVSCDSCLKSNFRGRRYKCLICYDFDLCEVCYEAGAISSRHTMEHPVQCILTRGDFDLFYAGETITNVDQPQSYTCPYCSRMGFTDVTLQEHVAANYNDSSFEVVCPICAAMPGGEPNLMTDDFAGHLTLEHRTGPRDLISFLDEPMAGNRHNVRRVPHSAHLPGRGGTSSRPRRSNMQFRYSNDQSSVNTLPLTEPILAGNGGLSSVFSSAALSSLSPILREPVDPIAELLSQLSGVRRSTSNNSSTPSQLQQLHMQLQLERQQVSAARQQLERLPRRTNHSHNFTTLRAAHTNSNTSYSLLLSPNNSQTQQPVATAPPVPQQTSNFLLDGLLDDLFLFRSSGDKDATDRYQFADNLLIATMANLKIQKDDETTASSDVQSNSQSNESSNLTIVTVNELNANSASASAEVHCAKPAPPVNRVLRGRARSDNHNAIRRADANKATNSNGQESRNSKGPSGSTSKSTLLR